MREKHQSVASHTPPIGDLAYNPGMYLDWESNRWCFGFQAGTQSTEPHKPGQRNVFLNDRKPISTWEKRNFSLRNIIWIIKMNLFSLYFLYKLPSTFLNLSTEWIFATFFSLASVQIRGESCIFFSFEYIYFPVYRDSLNSANHP